MDSIFALENAAAVNARSKIGLPKHRFPVLDQLAAAANPFTGSFNISPAESSARRHFGLEETEARSNFSL
jgi:hypothetical protein